MQPQQPISVQKRKDPFGFLIIDKPAGITSHDCVNRIRKAYGIRRVGHGGTLDPAVTGVLPIALGNATRLLTFLPTDKTYKGIIQLGKKTSTDDLQGTIIHQCAWPKLNKKSIELSLENFKGSIQQIPPQVSSVHLDGVRAYKRVNKGEVFALPKRTVVIHRLDLISWNQKKGQIEVSIHCSSGTYVRSLARDLGDSFQCGGCLATLRRTQALGFFEHEAESLPEKTDQTCSVNKLNLIDPLKVLTQLPCLKLLSEKEERYWKTGRNLESIKTKDSYIKSQNDLDTDFIIIIDRGGEMVGIGTFIDQSIIKPKLVFNAIR